MSKFRKKPRAKKKTFVRLPKSEYKNYINSPKWRAVRQRYFKSKLPQDCLICNSPKVDLHHRTYKRLGFEYLVDLMPLCREHHDDCHAYIKKHNQNLTSGTNRYLRANTNRWHGPQGKNPKFRVKTKARKTESQAKNSTPGTEQSDQLERQTA
jgi:uncharacterized protein YjaZ